MALKKHIPNFLTSMNLFCGCLAITHSFENDMINASYLIVLAAIFDFLDGLAARYFKVKSAIGKDMDSLADMVSFGLAPGIIIFQLLNISLKNYTNNINIIKYIAFIIPIFSALRLAKFNNDLRQTDAFIGLPTPANSLFIISLPLILFKNFSAPFVDIDFIRGLILNPVFLILLTIILSFLLVAELHLFSLKCKNIKWKNNKVRYIFMLSSIILFLIFHYIAIPLIIILYIVLSIINNNFNKYEIQSRN
jgi:CDP-diacylglycerol--serine O-phosphatidyltransferase